MATGTSPEKCLSIKGGVRRHPQASAGTLCHGLGLLENSCREAACDGLPKNYLYPVLPAVGGEPVGDTRAHRCPASSQAL